MVAPGTVVDSAGTGVITPGQAKYFAGGSLILAVGDVVATHTLGKITHPTNAIATGSAKVTIGGRPVAYSGSVAACGGPVVTTALVKVQVSV